MSDYPLEWPPPDESAQDPSAAELPDYWSNEIYDEFMANPSAFAAGQPSHGVARYSPLQPSAQFPPTGHGAQDPSAAELPDYWSNEIYDEFMANPSAFAAGQPSHGVARYSPLQPPAQFPPTGHGAQDPSAAGWAPVGSYGSDEIDDAFMEDSSASAAGRPSHGVARSSPLQPSASASAPAPTEQRGSVLLYKQWLATPKDKRPLPTREVIAGFAIHVELAQKVKLAEIKEGYLRAFETAHGIPQGTLKRCGGKKNRSVTRIDVQEGKVWQPGTYTAPTYLDSRTLRCVAMMYGGANPEEAYDSWNSLNPILRPEPNLKIVRGWAGGIWKIGVNKLMKFADEHAIPRQSTDYRLDYDKRVAIVTVEPWPPRAYRVSPSQQPTNTVTATYTELPDGNRPSLPQDEGLPSSPAAAWRSSGFALGRQLGR